MKIAIMSNKGRFAFKNTVCQFANIRLLQAVLGMRSGVLNLVALIIEFRANKIYFCFCLGNERMSLNLLNIFRSSELATPKPPVRVDVDSPSGLRMPSGNEFGANDQWIPGGKTDGGISEAIVKTEGMQFDIDYSVTNLGCSSDITRYKSKSVPACCLINCSLLTKKTTKCRNT